MRIEVRYYSRGGNTKKLAEAIAAAVGAEAKDISAPLDGPVDLLFLGGSIYAGGVDKSLRAFIEGLDSAAVKCAATFGSAALKKEPDLESEKLLAARGIPVQAGGFHCRGAFAVLHRGHPDAADLQNAAAFAKQAVENATG